MTVPDQYPQLPDGVAPRVRGIAGEFAAIRHDAEEAGRRSPPVISFPPPPADDLNFIRPETSTAVTAFASPWTNFGGAFAPAAYATIGSRVFLRGLVLTSTNLTGPFAIFRLPVGLRPATQELFVCTTGGVGAIRVDIYPGDGSVAIGPGTSIVANSFLSLSGINFSTLP